jgi:hypothetical protein
MTSTAAWDLVWAALAAAARGATLRPPAMDLEREALSLAAERGTENLVRRGLGRDVVVDERLAARARDTLEHVHGVLEGADVAHVFFKGPFSDALLWGGQGVRLGSDVDVLVRADDEARATAALFAASFAPAVYEGRRATAAAGKATNLVPVDGRFVPVDLHHRPLNTPPFLGEGREIVDAHDRRETAWGRLPGPSTEHMLVWSAGNLGGGRLQGLLRQAADAAAWLARSPVDWSRVVDIAHRWRASVPTFAFLKLLEANLRVDVPAVALDELARPAVIARAAARIFGVGGAPVDPSSVVLGLFAVEWPLSGRALWPGERVLRTLGFRAVDAVTERAKAARVSSSRSQMPVALESKVRVPPDVLMQEIDGEAVLLHLGSEKYFGLDESGTILFRALKETGSVAAALEAGLAEFDVDRDVLTRDLVELVEGLAAEGLVVVER